MSIALHLRTLEPEMAAAWRAAFDHPSVSIEVSDILNVETDAILSPANSFGFMDGGIDLIYSQHFGWDLQENLQGVLSHRFNGELLVGQAVVIQTGNALVPYLVSAPTMRVPQIIENTVNVYLAFRAALLAIREHNASGAPLIKSLASPALGAGIGSMPLDRVARQMSAAYSAVELGDTSWLTSARTVLQHNSALLQ